MERADFLKLGAFCLMRMSLKAQRELLSLAERDLPFTGPFLSQLSEIEKGYDFVKASAGKLGLTDFMDILAYCDGSTLNRIITDDVHKEAFLKSKETDGYFINANEVVYHTQDMDATMAWFKKVFGWPGVIEARDEADRGTYGMVEPYFKSNALNNVHPYFQFQKGEPVKGVVAFLMVWGLSNLRQRIIDNGWTKVTPVEKHEWGGSTFSVTTCDGSQMIFCEQNFWAPEFEIKT